MGCCISRFTPEAKKFKQEEKEVEEEEEEEKEYGYFQDKLVVSHYPKKVSPVPLPDKNSLIPIQDKVILPSPPTSKLSNSSPTLTSTTSNNTTVSSSSSSLSTASSSFSVSKDRSFSNEFLHACYRKNPHIVRISSIKEASLSLKTTNPPSPSRSSSLVRPNHSPSVPNRSNPSPKKGIAGSPVQKRILANSSLRHSTSTQQKSFRENQERIFPSTNSSPSFRVLKSPSPSRRFGMASSKVNPVESVSSSLRRESSNSGFSRSGYFREHQERTFASANSSSFRVLKSPSPSRRFGMASSKVNPVESVSSSLTREISNSGLSRTGLRNRSETRIHRITSKMDENVIKEVITSQNEPPARSEDAENPLISLDCFIFL